MMEGIDIYKINLYNVKPDYEAEYDTVWGNLHGNIKNQGDLIDLLNEKTDKYETEQLADTLDSMYEDLTLQMAEDFNNLSDSLKDVKNDIDSIKDNFYTKEDIDNKHFLTEHQKIKTINNQSLIGEGNIVIQGGGGGDLSNYYTKAEVDSKIQGESIVITALTEDLNVLDDKVSTIDEKVAENSLKIENKASKDELEALGNSVATNTNDISALKGQVADKADKDDVYSKTEIDNKGYLTQHQPLKTINNQSLVGEGNITIQGGGDAYDDTELRNKINSVSGDVQTLKTASGNTYTKTEADNKFAAKGDVPDMSNYYTKNQIEAKGYLTEIPSTYAKKTDIPTIPTNISAFVNDSGYLTQHQSLSNYYNKTEVDDKIAAAEIGGETELANYLKKTEAQGLYQPIGNYLTEVPSDYAKKTDIPTIPTNVSAFNNDKGYISNTDYTIMDMVGTKADGTTITFKILVKNDI